MTRSITPIVLTLLLSLVALMGVAPTASADDGGPVCAGSKPGDPPQNRLCVSPSDENCMVWYVNDFWYQCIVEPIIIK